jgi:hypothetical protein
MKRAGLLRSFCAALVFLIGAGAACAEGTPRLVALLVIDGLPQRQVLAYRDQLAPDGLARFLDRGAWFADAHYGHALTDTASGHAALLTGAYPDRTGIVGNEWRDRITAEPVYCTGDASAAYIGHTTQPLDGTSPRNLKAQTLGDVLRRIDARSRVVAVSGKDRGAILPAGRAGTAYIYMRATGQFASTTYYMEKHPAWVDAFNAGRPADRYFKAQWTPLLPPDSYARSVPDDQPWFGPRGGRLPMMMGVAADDAPGPAFYSALLAGPFADQLTLDFARAAIAGERLGRDDSPDLLSVSLSGHDYVNHRWSAESRLSHDHVLQLDRMIQAFFHELDTTVGKDHYVAVLTADHGFMPAPAFSQAQGLATGRISTSQVLARVNAQLEREFGAVRLVPFISASALVLDRRAISHHGLDFDTIARSARDMLLADPAIAAAYTRQELEAGSRAGAPFFEQMRRSWHKDVSGDVQFVLAPLWTAAPAGVATTHGSPHPYDTHVPVMIYGPRWVKPGRVDSRVEVIDIAPTLAALLRVPAPAASEGRPLPLP